MTSAATFALSVNHGKQEEHLHELAKLMSRMRLMKATRKQWLESQFNERGLKFNESEHESSMIPTLFEISKSHNVWVYEHWKPTVPINYEYIKKQLNGSASLGSTVRFELPKHGLFVHDCLLHVRLSSFSATSAQDKVRYVAYPGMRIIKSARFMVKGRVLQEIFTEDYIKHMQFNVPKHKRSGWNRIMGQEEIYTAYSTPEPTTDEFRYVNSVSDGPQTLKNTQPALDLHIPLLFWFRELHSCLPNGLIPFEDAHIEITFANPSDLIAYADYGGGGSYTTPDIHECSMFSNHIFMPKEIHDILLKKFTFNLIRITKRHKQILTSPKDSILLNEIKHPVENLYIAFRPRANLSISSSWYKMRVMTSNNCKFAVVSDTPGLNTIKSATSRYFSESDSVDVVGVNIHSNKYYADHYPGFYSDYQSYQRGPNVNTPDDAGWLMVPFALNANIRAPNGHINVSRARELYLNYTSSYITHETPVDLIVLSDSINFLDVKDGAMVVRYST